MSHFSPVRTIKIPAFRTPDVPTKSARQVLSLDRAHSHFRTEPNVPLSPDPRARYSISYASGVLEHRIEPCRTLEEAQMRIVLLSCEVERISEVNYRLVRENELLKFQPDRGNRVADLESKLAIILAENEKLVQVVDEIHQFYTTEKAHSATSNIRDFDRVMKQIEEVKQSPRALYSFGEPGIVKAGVSGERSQPGSLNDIIHKNSGISAENERLRKELSALRAKCQELGEMQAKLNRYEAIMKALVIENERLNEMFRSKVICENKEPRRSHNEREEKLTENVEFEVLDLDKAKEENEAMKEYYRVQELDIPQLNMKAEELIRENKRLYNEMKRQYDSPVKNALAKAFGSPTQSTQSPNEKKIRGHVEVLLVKNEELHNLVNEMHLDADDLRRRLREAEFSKDTQVRSLNSKVDVLQSEKAALNGALKEKETSLQLLKIEKDRVDGLLKEKRNELELIKVGSPIKEQGLTFQIRNLETEVRELKRKLDVANIENDRLNAKIKDLTANPQDESLNKQLNKARIENEEFLRTMRALDESRRQQIPGGVYAEPDKAFDVGKIANVGDYMHQHVYQAKSGNEELLKSMRALEESRTKSLTSSPTRSHLQATDDILNKQLIAARVENDDLRRRLEAEQREKGSTESIQILTKENERLSALLAGTRSQNEDLMRKISNLDTTSRAYILEAENKTLKKEIEDLKVEISVLKAENRRLDSLVIEKARDIETLKASLEGKERLISGLSMSMSATGRSGSIEAPYEKHTMLRSDMLRQPDVMETKDQEIKRLNESLGRVITEQEKLKKEVLIKQKTIDSLVVSKIKPEGDISPLGADNVRLTQSAVYGTGSDVHEELKKTKNELKDLQAKVHILQGENDGLKKQLQVKDIHLDLQLQGSPKSPGSRAGSLENVGGGQVVVGAENIQNVQRRVQVLENDNRKLKEFAQSKEGGNKLLVELQTISNQALASQVGQTGQAGQAGHVSQVTSVQAGQIGQIGQTGQTGYVSHVTSAEIGGHQDVLDVGHQVTQLKQENERLNGIIEAKGTEVRSLREDIEAKKVALDTYKAYQQEGGEAKRKLEIMTNENKMLKNLVNDKERAFINLNTKLMQLTQELTEGPGSVLVGQDESRTRTSPPTIHGQVGPQAVEGPKTAEERAIEGQIEALRKIIATKATVNEGSPRARQEERGRGERSPNRSLDKSQGSPKGTLTRGATGSPKGQGSPRVATTGSPKGHGGESRVQGSTSGTTRVATSPTGTPKGQVAGAKGVSGRTESPQASPKGQAGTKVSGAVERSGTAGTPKGGQAGRVGARGAAPARLETSGSRTESPQTSPKGQSVINKSLSGVGDREGTEGSLERQGESRVQQGSTRIATSPTSTPKGHVAGVKGVAGRTESPQTSPKGQAAINKSLGGTSKVVNSPTGTPRGGESAAGTGRGVSGKVSRTGSGVGSPQASPREGKVEGANKYRPSPLGTPKGQAGAAGKSVLGKGDARARTTESPQTSPKGQGVINRSLSGAGDRDRTEGSLERQGEGKGVARRVERSPNMQLEGPELLNELVALEDENEKLREIIDTREKEMHEIAEISLEIKSEITSIKQENERLIGIIHDKVGEIRMLKKQMESGQRSVETTAHDEEEIRRQTEQLVNQARQEVRNIVEDRGELRNINISLKSSGVNMNTNVLEALSGDFSNEPKVEKVEEKPRTKQEYERVFDDKNAEIRALKKAIEVKDRALESFKDSLIEADREEKDKFEAMELENKQLNELLLAVKKKGTKSEMLKMTEEKQHAQKEAVQLKRHNTQLLNTLDEKQSEIENLLNSLDEKDRTLESVKGFDSGMNDLEKMVEMLVAENERLKDLLNQKMAESKRLREERNKARKELSKMGNTREEDSPSPISSAKLGKGADAGLLDKLTKENMRMMRNLEEKDRQIQELTEELVSQQRAEQELKEEIADEIENLKYDARKSEDEKRMAEEKISRLNTEIERVQGHLNRTMRELQDEKKKFSELDVLRAQEIDRIRQQFEAIDKNDIELGGKELIAQFEAERLAYETQIEQIQTNLTDLEREHKVLKDENKELRKLSATRLREVEEMKRQAAELKESFNLQSIELKSEIGRLKLEKQEIEQTLIKHQSEKNKDQAEIKSLQDLDTNNKGEIKSLNSLMIESKANYHELAEQHSELKKMYDNLKNEVQDKALESMQRLEKLDILEREVNELEKSKLDYKKRAERNSYELMKKNRELVESIQTLEAARLKYQEVVMSYQSVNTDRSLQDA